MKRLPYSLLLVIPIFFALNLSAANTSALEISEQPFEKELSRAVRVFKTSGWTQEDEHGRHVDNIADDFKKVKENTWTFTFKLVTNSYLGDEYIVYSIPTVVTNHGDHITYAFAINGIQPYIAPELLKKLQNETKEFKEDYPHTDAAFDVEKNKLFITLTHTYADIRDTILAEGHDDDHSLNQVNQTLLWNEKHFAFAALELQNEIAEKMMDELKDKDIAYLSKDEITFLFAGIGVFEKATPEGVDAKEGFFSYQREKKYQYEVIDHGNSLEVIVWKNTADHTFKKQNELLLKKMQAYVKEEGKPKGASNMIIDWYPGHAGNVFMFKSVYTFDNSYTYGDLLEYYNDYRDEYIPELYEKIDEWTEEITEEIYETKIDYLSKDAFKFIFPELVKREKKSKSSFTNGKEGFFTLQFKDEDYDDNYIKYYYEYINHGDTLDILVWDNVPKDSDKATKKKILEHIKSYVKNEGTPEHASSITADWYPGYEGGVYMIKTTYTFNDSYTYEELIEAYKNLKEDYMPDLFEDYMEFRIDAIKEYRNQ